ncbi:MAG: PAS domain-containing sensor histidine kinase [Burkholderiales bacterium PBB2]|nr:MAG: PAS domain-containing sensor histidine kinase [Burkholderiales bacterium PBB2]
MLQGLQALQVEGSSRRPWAPEAEALLRSHREIGRIEARDRQMRITEASDTPFSVPLFGHWPRAEMAVETELACRAAQRAMAPSFARSQFVPMPGGLGAEVVDVCVPVQQAGQFVGFSVASLVLPTLLEELQLPSVAHSHEISFIEPDGTRLARAGTVRGAGVFIADRLVDLPGAALQVRVDAVERRPSLIPNLATALVLGLSIALFAVVLLLLRDGRRRARAERALAEALAFRKAMEDSLLTGLRARDRAGRIVYVNPAFCAMVGFSTDELTRAAVPPYWPPDQVPVYQQRQAERLGGGQGTPPGAGGAGTPAAQTSQTSREGYETEFMRKNGERFPVMVYEAPLVDGTGQHTGWMSAVLDLSAQRRVEDLSRQQQERLQATARLATVGEMASLLSHELNQPLAAIASYATASVNLLAEESEDPQTPHLVRQAALRIAEQAERAGRVIKSVHDFVRRREQAREDIGVDLLFEAVLPLVRLQARKSGTRIELDLPQPSPRVRCDRTMVEQVLLNLSRNAIQAMEDRTAPALRVLTLRAAVVDASWVSISVLDRGPGIPPEVGRQLYTPFFTTRAEGMGLGLSLCRTVVEQHGGAMDYFNREAPGGTEFRFSLPNAGHASKAAPARTPGESTP